MKFTFVLTKENMGSTPLGVTLISSYLKARQICVDYIDADKTKNVPAEIARREPNMIGFSTTTGLHGRHLHIARDIKKEYYAPIIFGGPHPTYFPEFLENDGVDFICRGEGEIPLVNLLTALEKKANLLHTPLENIDFKLDGHVIRNPVRLFFPDLDQRLFADPNFFPPMENPDMLNKWARVNTSSGCLYNCAFCFQHLYKKTFRQYKMIQRSVDNVIAELKEIQKVFDFNRVGFCDNIFWWNQEWNREFAEKYPAAIGKPFSCEVVVNTLDQESIALLKKAGCASVGIGLEAGNEKIREIILNKKMKKETFIIVCNICRDYGINVRGMSMVGVPHETVDSLFETIRLNLDCKIDSVIVNNFTPLPRTRITEYAILKGFFDGDFDALPRQMFHYEGLVLDFREDKERMMFVISLFYLLVIFPFLIPLAQYSVQGNTGTWSKRFIRFILAVCAEVEKGFYRFCQSRGWDSRYPSRQVCYIEK